MPDRSVHAAAGVIAGALSSVADAHTATSPHPEIELVAATLGGLVGGLAPDWIEPASAGPRHRGIAHSVTTGALLTRLPVEAWQRHWRARGVHFGQRAEALPAGSWPQFLARLLSYLCFAVASCLAGMRAGYLSHLALDLTTPAGLPLTGLSPLIG